MSQTPGQPNHPWVSLKPVRNGGGNGDGGGGKPPPPPAPPPPIPMPDLAFLIAQCPDLTDPNTVASLRRAVTSNSLMGAGADVRMFCSPEALTAGGSIDVLRVGAWASPPASTTEATGRDSLLKNLTMLRPDQFKLTDTFAFFMNGSLIKRAAASGFASLASTGFRVATDGTPNSSGPLTLSGMTVSLMPPSSLVTIVTGSTSQTWPATNFTLTATDTLSIVSLAVSSSTTTSMTKDSGADILAGIVSAILGIFVLPFVIASVVFFVEVGVAASAGPPSGLGGASLGSAIASQLPTSALAPPAKLLFRYRQVQVDPGGVLARGTFDIIIRSPAVQLVGPPFFKVKEGTASVGGIYTAHPVDLVPDTSGSFNPKWSAAAGATIAGTPALSVPVTFDTSSASAGDKLQQTLTVQLTDAQLPNPLSASMTVTIEVVADPEPKPWGGRTPLPIGAHTP